MGKSIRTGEKYIDFFYIGWSLALLKRCIYSPFLLIVDWVNFWEWPGFIFIGVIE